MGSVSLHLAWLVEVGANELTILSLLFVNSLQLRLLAFALRFKAHPLRFIPSLDTPPTYPESADEGQVIAACRTATLLTDANGEEAALAHESWVHVYAPLLIPVQTWPCGWDEILRVIVTGSWSHISDA
jgi:hypothetical protein